MNKILLIFLVIFTFISCKSKPTIDKETENNQSIKDSLTLEIKKLNHKNYFNGLAVSIVDSTGIIYHEGIGFADVQSKKLYSVNTIQPIASVSKTFISIALMKAQEKGLLNLDDPIKKFLPFDVINPNHPNKDITIRQLATHTSTIVDTENYMERSYFLKDELDGTVTKNKNIPQRFNPSNTKIPLSVFLANYLSSEGKWYGRNAFSTNSPGQLFEYTNVGASLAAHIIEIVSNKSYAEFTTEYIMKPLKMNSSGWDYSDIDFENVSTLYSDPQTEIPYYSLITYPDGGFLTTINDLSKYLNELIKGYSGNGKLLSPESYNELYKAQLKEENFSERDANHPYDDEYNIGIFMGISGTGNIGHTGGDPGVSSIMFFNSEDKMGRILLINTNVNNQEGVDVYYGIFNMLGEYGQKLKLNDTTLNKVQNVDSR